VPSLFLLWRGACGIRSEAEAAGHSFSYGRRPFCGTQEGACLGHSLVGLLTALALCWCCGVLQEAGLTVDPMGDINTEQEKKLGELVKAK